MNEIQELLEQTTKLTNAVNVMARALMQITEIAGNMPDDWLSGRTGPNDAAAHGLLLIEARRIALEALQKASG